MVDIIKAAINYEKYGYSVIPLKRNKKPYIPWTEYQKRRATAEEIKAWWNRYPDAMIGIVTGSVSGLFVIDCDTSEGFDSINALLPDSAPFPQATTPRGGRHIWFKYPDEIGLTIGARVLPGVDFRGEGGYVVAPPSVSDKGSYSWQLRPGRKETLPQMPTELIEQLLSSQGNDNNIYNKYNNINNTTYTLNSNPSSLQPPMFEYGRRDNDLFHVANCLVKGGMPEAEITQVLKHIILSWGEKPSDSWVKEKVESAVKRAKNRERSISAEVREWVLTTRGNFVTTDVHRELQLTTRDHMKATTMALSRLCEGPNPLIERYGNKRGCYRRIEAGAELVNFLTAPTGEFPVAWPLDLGDMCVVYPGNIIIVAGSKGSGKTAFLLNVARLNMDKHEICYLNSEMGDTEFRKRLEFFDMPLTDWKIKAFHRHADFQDLIDGSRKIYIIDFLEVTDEFWKIAETIRQIHEKLKDGIAVIGLQKADGKKVGRGGDFSREKARLYVSLDYVPEFKSNRIEIVDAKAWRTDINPRGMVRRYKLVRGCKFHPLTFWSESLQNENGRTMTC